MIVERLVAESMLVKYGYTIDLTNESYESIFKRLIVVTEIMRHEAEEQEKMQRDQQRASGGGSTATLSRPMDPRPRLGGPRL